MTLSETEPNGSEKPIRRVMVIDDASFDQKMYRRIMERSGLIDEIIGHTSADQALDDLRQHPDREIDVIFLDINMPRMDGFEFLDAASSALGDQFTRICIVMLTTSLDPKDRARATRFTVVKDFMNKPLTIDNIQHVAELLSGALSEGEA